MNEPRMRMRRSVGLSVSALLASSATLVCCVLPAVLVAVGAGAALAGLVTAAPGLVWLSEHKALVFGAAGSLLMLAAWAVWRSRSEPCPTDPKLARACLRLRRVSSKIFWIALACFVLGVLFAFLLPVLRS